MKKILIAVIASLFAIHANANNYETIRPDATYLYVHRDTCDLYLDLFRPTPGSISDIDGVQKPTILYMFAGGFMMGQRSDSSTNKWFKELCDAGYTVITIDYRLGLKGCTNVGINGKFINTLDNAIKIAVEDLFSATNFIIENADELGVNPKSIIISGASAGAMSVLHAEWDICNGHEVASVLPEGFNYAGLIAFSGAVFSKVGAVRFRKCAPCPMLLFHGTNDKIVNYKQISFMNLHFEGSSVIARTLRDCGFNYRIYRLGGNGHEIALSMSHFLDIEQDFMEHNVMKAQVIRTDALISDPTLEKPSWGQAGFKSIY